MLKDLASAHPDKTFKQEIDKWSNYCLADPSFNRSDWIDLVIGADLFNEIIQPGIIKRGRIVASKPTGIFK